jgi:acetyl-CoA acetyltransferase
MPRTFAGQAAIAGIGHTEFSKDSGRSELRLACEAAQAAIRDAGLTPRDIDGTVTFTLDTNGENELMNNLGIRELRWMSRTPNGGAGAAATIQHAAAAVGAGICDNVLVSSTARSTNAPATASACRPAPSGRSPRTGTCPSACARPPRCTRSGTTAGCSTGA